MNKGLTPRAVEHLRHVLKVEIEVGKHNMKNPQFNERSQQDSKVRAESARWFLTLIDRAEKRDSSAPKQDKLRKSKTVMKPKTAEASK